MPALVIVQGSFLLVVTVVGIVGVGGVPSRD
jgi:hypothetical protein